MVVIETDAYRYSENTLLKSSSLLRLHTQLVMANHWLVTQRTCTRETSSCISFLNDSGFYCRCGRDSHRSPTASCTSGTPRPSTSISGTPLPMGAPATSGMTTPTQRRKRRSSSPASRIWSTGLVRSFKIFSDFRIFFGVRFF